MICPRRPYRQHSSILLLLTILSSTFVVGACSLGTPNTLLRHGKAYPDGTERLQQVLRYGDDSVATLADVRASMSVNTATAGTRFRTRDGAQLAYTLVVPHAPVDSTKLVVLLRGHDRSGFRWTETQLRLASLGYPSVALDLRGTGESTGDPTFGIEERNDVHALIDYLRNTLHIGSGGVALVGRTFGSGVALQAAATDHSGVIRTVIVEGAFPKFDAMAARMLPQPTRDALATQLTSRNVPIDSLNSAHWLKKIDDLPILFVWGERDDYISERERGVTALVYEPATPAHRQVMMLAKLHHGIDRDPLIWTEEEYQEYLSQREAFIRHFLPLR